MDLGRKLEIQPYLNDKVRNIKLKRALKVKQSEASTASSIVCLAGQLPVTADPARVAGRQPTNREEQDNVLIQEGESSSAYFQGTQPISDPLCESVGSSEVLAIEQQIKEVQEDEANTVNRQLRQRESRPVVAQP